MSEDIIQYGSYDLDGADQDDQATKQITGDVWMELVEGENVVRILPPQPGQKSPFRVTAMHYIDAVPGLEKLVAFACPRVELREPCPACQKAEELSRSSNPLDRDRAFKLQASLRVYANVIDRADPGQDGMPNVKILGFGKMIYNQLKTIRRNARLGGDFTNPTSAGFDIIITREGSGMSSKYQVAADRNSSPLAGSTEMIAVILAGAHNLDSKVTPEVPAELLQAWGAVGRVSRGAQPAATPRSQLPAQAASPITIPSTPVGASAMPARAATAAESASKVVDPFDDEG